MTAARFRAFCRECSAELPPADRLCGKCRATPRFEFAADAPLAIPGAFGIDRYRRLLPLPPPEEDRVDLPAGGTPLLSVPGGPPGERLWVKDETRNGTGSHKDRQLAIALRHARRAGAAASLIVSAGSTGISHAAMAARCGMRSIVLMSGTQPRYRMVPLLLHGSAVVAVDEQIDRLLERVEVLAQKLGLYHASTAVPHNSHQAEGPKTIAFEIFESLGRAPGAVVAAVGGGGTLRGIYDGFAALRERGLVERVPRMAGVVPREWNSLEVAFREGAVRQRDIPFIDRGGSQGEAVLSKLAHARPPDGAAALHAVRESEGTVASVTDEEAVRGARWLASRAGVIVEPASGAVAAALPRLREEIPDWGEAVLLASGSGYRELPLLMDLVPEPAPPVAPAQLEETLESLVSGQPENSQTAIDDGKKK